MKKKFKIEKHIFERVCNDYDGYIFTENQALELLRYSLNNGFTDKEIRDSVIEEMNSVDNTFINIPLIYLALLLKEYVLLEEIINRGLFNQSYMYEDRMGICSRDSLINRNLSGKAFANNYISFAGLLIADNEMPERLFTLIWDKIVSKKHSKKRQFCDIIRDYRRNALLEWEKKDDFYSINGLKGLLKMYNSCPKLLSGALLNVEHNGYDCFREYINESGHLKVEAFISVMYKIFSNNSNDKIRLLDLMFEYQTSMYNCLKSSTIHKYTVINEIHGFFEFYLNLYKYYMDSDELKMAYLAHSVCVGQACMNFVKEDCHQSYVKRQVYEQVIGFIGKIKTIYGNNFMLKDLLKLVDASCRNTFYYKKMFEYFLAFKDFYHYDIVFDLSDERTCDFVFDLIDFEFELFEKLLFCIDSFIRDDLEEIFGVDYSIELAIEKILNSGNEEMVITAVDKGLILKSDMDLCWEILHRDSFCKKSKSRILPLILAYRLSTELTKNNACNNCV